MEECEYATGEAIFEAKACDEIRTGVRGRRIDLFTSGGCVRSGSADTGLPQTPNIAPGHAITLGEEEIADVSLATFYVFDKENTGSLRGGVQVARGCGCGGCSGCRGCRGCRACRGCGGAADAAAAEVAVCRGGLAASARPDRFPITLTNAGHYGRARQSRPGQSMSCLRCRPRAGLRMTAGGSPALSRNASARAGRGNSSGRRIRLAPANRGGGQGARADVMKADRKTSVSRHARKEVAQFAPNFTVYVLPPDVVCLYSEDRKFFLHGELYCALATAMAKGGKSLPELVRELGRRFSVRQDRGSPQAAD